MSKIAVLGDRDSVLGFRALGLETVFAEQRDEAARQLHRLAREDYAIIYITEQLARQIPAEIAKYNEKLSPAVILIPGKGGSLGVAQAALQSAVERAVGADIS
ncbi:MAG: V-type ATP synthase subunit F [Oscillospiraceae bacterium]